MDMIQPPSMTGVGVILKPGMPLTVDLAAILLSLRVHGLNVKMEPHALKEQFALSFAVPADVKEMVETCAFIISFGGDGTMLGVMRDVAKHTHDRNVHLIGVNMGTLGFITDVEMSGGNGVVVTKLLEIIQGKKFVSELRGMLQVALNHEVTELAANDVLIQRAGGRLLDFSVHFNGRFAYDCRADGLLISTPTGSTAYSLAAGGPIIQPTADVILVSPMMPQNLSSRPIILNSANTSVEVHLTGNEDAKMYIDGNEFEQHDRIFRISRGPSVLYARLTNDFTVPLRNKLGWNQ